jgi:hypothetical protein
MRIGGVLGLCAAVLVGGCNRDSNQAPAATHVVHVNKPATAQAQTPAQLTAGMVEAATLGKSTVPVNVKFAMMERPTIDKPLDIIIAVMPQIEAELVTLTITDPGNMGLPPGGSPIEIPAVDPTQVYRQVLKVTPTAEGVQLLALSVALRHDEITETRTFSVPIIVTADADTAANGKP